MNMYEVFLILRTMIHIPALGQIKTVKYSKEIRTPVVRFV